MVAGEVAEGCQHLADPVELAGHRVGALLDPPLERAGVAVELVPALGPAGVVLAVRAGVARVVAQLTSQRLDLLLLRRRARRARARRRWRRGRRGEPVRDVAQSRGQVAAHLGVAGVELPWQPDPRHRRDGRREVDQAQPAGLPFGGQHLRAGAVGGGAAPVEHDREAGELAARDLDHVAAMEVRQRRDHLLAAVGLPRARHRLLEVGDAVPQRGVLHEVAPVAGRALRRSPAGRPGSWSAAARARPRPCQPGTGRRTSPGARGPARDPPARPG